MYLITIDGLPKTKMLRMIHMNICFKDISSNYEQNSRSVDENSLLAKDAQCPKTENVYFGEESPGGMPQMQKIAFKHIPPYSRVNWNKIQAKKYILSKFDLKTCIYN